MNPQIKFFTKYNFNSICDLLSQKDADLKLIIDTHGYPPMWNRKPTFETLLHIILEQQVSLASALAALHKLKEKIGKITPEKIIALTDAELKACYFSRQKIVYAKHLAENVINKELDFKSFSVLNDEAIRSILKNLKGVGDWTADVFLMMALQRPDLFPAGDIALINSIKSVKQLPANTTKEDILLIAEKWRPYRTIAAFMLWHAYLEKKKK
jgi:DNA-3-methyladenine glycosylase II